MHLSIYSSYSVPYLFITVCSHLSIDLSINQCKHKNTYTHVHDIYIYMNIYIYVCVCVCVCVCLNNIYLDISFSLIYAKKNRQVIKSDMFCFSVLFNQIYIQ